MYYTGRLCFLFCFFEPLFVVGGFFSLDMTVERLAVYFYKSFEILQQKPPTYLRFIRVFLLAAGLAVIELVTGSNVDLVEEHLGEGAEKLPAEIERLEDIACLVETLANELLLELLKEL